MNLPAVTPRWAPRVTVATVVSDGDQVLMVAEHINGQRLLNQPAGHLEPDESLCQAALRETLEETGWEVELTGLIGIYQWRAPDGTDFLRATFAARPLRHHPERPLDTGIESALWLPPSSLVGRPDLRSPLVARCVSDWQAGRLYPLSVLEMLQ